MLFSKSKPIDSKEPKRRSTLVTLLNPDFGASIRPIGESTRVFVNLIAMLFAMNGLFPKDHPAFANGSDVRLTLQQVIGTAWSNLTFTEKDIPKTLFFFAVIGCMVVTTLAVVVGVFSLFIGSAHAATPSASAFFTPATNDLAQNWIDYLFLGKALIPSFDQAGSTLTSITSIGNTVGSINIQCAMITALGFYSDAVLLVAALILFYHLAAMVVETAHHGVVMGKRANQVWAPIRLVVAIGLLVPIGSGGQGSQCPNGGSAGLNSAQYITIKIAELGSALASNTWATFIQALSAEQFNYIQPSTPAVDKIVEDIFLMEGCMAAWNHFITQAGTQLPSITTTEQILPPSPVNDTQATTGQYWNYTAGTPANPDIDKKNVCGYIFLPSNPVTSVNYPSSDAPVSTVDPNQTTLPIRNAIGQAHLTVLTSMISEIRNFVAVSGSGGQPDVSYFVPDWNAGQYQDNPPPDNSDYRQAASDYANQLNSALTSAFNNANTDSHQDVMTALGWIAAGSWLNTIARDQGALTDAVYDGMPVTQRPMFTDAEKDDDQVARTITALFNMKVWMDRASTATDLSSAPSPCTLQGAAGQAGITQGGEGATPEPLKEVLRFIEKDATEVGLWSDPNYSCPLSNGQSQKLFTLGVQFNSGNALGELAAYGHKAMRLALQSVNYMFLSLGAQDLGAGVGGFGKGMGEAAGAADSKIKKSFGGLFTITGGALQALGGVGAALFGFLATIFLTIGVTLGYIVPLIPFVHFFFAAIAWGLVLLEGVVAMPLVALAHLNPEGDGLPGGMAKQAYFMLLGLFMRPVLIIFGFIVSLLIFFLSMFLLNKLFAITVVGTGGMAQGYATVSRIIFTFIYVFLAYTCAVQCFKIVDSMPETVFRWISINIQHQRIADGGSTLQTAGPLVTGVAAQQGMQAISGAGQALQDPAASAGRLGGQTVGNLGSGTKSTGAAAPAKPPP